MDLLWGVAFALVMALVCGAWFYWFGHAEKARQARPYAKRTFRYAGLGFLAGVAVVSGDLGDPPTSLVAFTVCCGFLLYVASWAAIASDDESLVLVNLTGRALMLTGPELAPFYTLPAPRDNPPGELPPVFPRTCYVVSPALGRLGTQAGRTDMFTVDASTATDCGDAGLLVRRLVSTAPALGHCEGA